MLSVSASTVSASSSKRVSGVASTICAMVRPTLVSVRQVTANPVWGTSVKVVMIRSGQLLAACQCGVSGVGG